MVEKKDKTVVKEVATDKKVATSPNKTTAKSKTVEPKKPTARKLRLNEIDKSTELEIKNNLTGSLVYICPRNHTRYSLDSYGDTDVMPIDEVINLKNSKRKFLDQYWMVFSNVITGDYTLEEILDALRISDLYKGDYKVMLDVDGFILGSPAEIKKTFPKLNKYAQEVIVKRASRLYKTGEMKDLETYQFFVEIPEASNLF